MATFKCVALQLHEHCDRGEDNKNPDWLIEQSIARQVARAAVTLRNGENVDKIVVAIVAQSRIKTYFLQRLRQQQKFASQLVSVCLHFAISGAICVATQTSCMKICLVVTAPLQFQKSLPSFRKLATSREGNTFVSFLSSYIYSREAS